MHNNTIRPLPEMKSCGILLIYLVAPTIDFAKGEMYHIFKTSLTRDGTKLILYHRIGWALSFSSGASLPGRRSAGTDVQCNRDVSKMDVQCDY